MQSHDFQKEVEDLQHDKDVYNFVDYSAYLHPQMDLRQFHHKKI